MKAQGYSLTLTPRQKSDVALDRIGGFLGLVRFFLLRSIARRFLLGLFRAAAVGHFAGVGVRSREDGVAFGALDVGARVRGFRQTQLGPTVGAAEFDRHEK